MACMHFSPLIHACRDSSPEMSYSVSSAKQNMNSMGTIKSKRLRYGIKAAIGFIFLVMVLGSSVLSKLTLVSLTDKLRAATGNEAVTLYWYLQFILLIPTFITFLRCLVFGVIGKTTKSFPWPKTKAIIFVSVYVLLLNVLYHTDAHIYTSL